MNWDSPSPGVHEAFTTRTTDVVLEVFDPFEEEDGEFFWWALSEGRVIGSGRADSLASAKEQCEVAAR